MGEKFEFLTIKNCSCETPTLDRLPDRACGKCGGLYTGEIPPKPRELLEGAE